MTVPLFIPSLPLRLSRTQSRLHPHPNVIRATVSNNVDESSSTLARLLAMQQNILKRRQELRDRQSEKSYGKSTILNILNEDAETDPRDKLVQHANRTEASAGGTRHVKQPVSPVYVPTSTAPPSAVSSPSLSSPTTRKSTPSQPLSQSRPFHSSAPLQQTQMSSSTSSHMGITDISSATESKYIYRYNVCLPWKGRDARAAQLEPDQVEVPLLSSFSSRFSDGRQPYLLPRQSVTTNQPKRASMQKPMPKSPTTAIPVDADKNDLILSALNNEQEHSVTTDGLRACLVLAGPGSGKTRVLTHRIAYLVHKCGAHPSSILAVTFTNKAAEEMKNRVSHLLRSLSADEDDVANAGEEDPIVQRLSVGTFHWLGVRLLRQYSSNIEVQTDFDICDSSDSRTVVSRVLKRFKGSSVDSQKVREMTALISKLKNEPEGERRDTWKDGLYNKVREVQMLYDKELRSMNMLDFDDLLLETRRMLVDCPDVLTELQDRFQFVLVDEWQDTNRVQFDIVSRLSGNHRNLFVVGDADQSIYKFRGADSGNMDRYRRVFPNAEQVVLSSNYRSTDNIVQAAQAVIEQNRHRPRKRMVALNENGDDVKLVAVPDARREASFIISAICDLVQSGAVRSFSDCAIMYRTNAQSRILEEIFVQDDVPYALNSGVRFFERKEVKDVIAYLKVVCNHMDNNALERIINTPPRGIGKVTVDVIELHAQRTQLSLFEAIESLLSTTDANEDGRQTLNEVGLNAGQLKKLSAFM